MSGIIPELLWRYKCLGFSGGRYDLQDGLLRFPARLFNFAFSIVCGFQFGQYVF